MKNILFIIPIFDKIGGVEATLLRFAKQSNNNIYILELYKLKLIRFDPMSEESTQLSLMLLLTKKYDFICHFFWQVGLMSMFLFHWNKNIIFFVNSTIAYKNLKYLGFILGLRYSRTVIADGNASYRFLMDHFPMIKNKLAVYEFSPPQELLEKIKNSAIKKTKDIVFVGRWSEEKGVALLTTAVPKFLEKLTIITDRTDLVPKSVKRYSRVQCGNDYEFVLREIASHKYIVSFSPHEGNSLVLREALHFSTLPIFLSRNEYTDAICKFISIDTPLTKDTIFTETLQILERDVHGELSVKVKGSEKKQKNFVEDFDSFT